jgi:hypothetical protein
MTAMPNARRSLIELKAYTRHGDIYRWLRENYERIEPEIVKLERSWGSIAADISAEGVKGARGKEPYAKSVRRIWPRVCRDVAAERERDRAENIEREARAEKRRQYPSSAPKDLRPIPALPVISESRASVPAAGQEEVKPWEDKNLSPERAERIKENYEKMERRSKWVTRSDRHLSREEYHVLAMEFDLGYRKRYLKEGK